MDLAGYCVLAGFADPDFGRRSLRGQLHRGRWRDHSQRRAGREFDAAQLVRPVACRRE